MITLRRMFGDTLLTKEGEQPTKKVLGDATAIGLYFSAHWCPPCRTLTPQIAEWYTNTLKEKGMEIIYVSRDRTEEQYKSYYKEQPWVAIPYEEQDKIDALSKKYKVKSIPTLVILDSDGKLITKEGREAVSGDPTGERYPWVPLTGEQKAKEVLDLLGEDVVKKAKGKAISLYFGAHWVPPARTFLTKLISAYEAGLSNQMEVVYCSSDRTETDFASERKQMPWLVLPYEKRVERDKLAELCGVTALPNFTILTPDGNLITHDGRTRVADDPTGATFPGGGWYPQPINNINSDHGALNDEKCVIALGQDELLFAVLKMVAQRCYDETDNDIREMPYRFFRAPPGTVTDQVRKLTKVQGDRLVLLDIPNGGSYYICESRCCCGANVREWLADVAAGKIEKQTLASQT